MANEALSTNSTLNSNIISNLESSVPNKANLSSNLRDEKNNISINVSNKNADIINSVNSAVLLDYLSPEIKNNEEVKRNHKYILIVLVTIFLVFQFKTVHSMSISIMTYATKDGANIEILKLLIGFVSAYITSVVVELIAILKYVVKRVFDTSIKELIELFKEDDKPNQIKE